MVTGTMTGSAAAGLAAGGLAMGGAKFLASQVFTNPKAVSWLVRQTQVPFGALAQQLAILAKDAQKWAPEDRDIAEQMVSTLGNVDWPQVFMAWAVADATVRNP